MTDASQLGQMLGALGNQVTSLQTNLYPDDPDGAYYLAPVEKLSLEEFGTLYALDYDPASFVLDHPVQGYVDSPSLLIDGGYLGGTAFPLSFPMAIATGPRVLYTF